MSRFHYLFLSILLFVYSFKKAWFNGVQTMITLGFVFAILILAVLTISLFTNLRHSFIFQTGIAVGSTVSGRFIFMNLLI